jgi:two-component system C4-dicarboxylate transport response regulator DctD
MTAATILFIDDDDDLRAAHVQGLELAGFSVRSFAGGHDALKGITPDFAGVVVTDVRMPGMDGFEVFKRIQAIDDTIPVVLMTGHGDVPMAVRALKDGAYDFLTKPFAMDTLSAALRRALEARRLVLENRQLRALYTAAGDDEDRLLGESAVMQHLRQTIAQIAAADVDILIAGETGVGKERVARTIHRQSDRRHKPFVQVNCAVMPDSIFAAELFGVESGARLEAGAPLSRRNVGKIEKAQKGTLFLDDIEGLSLPLQAKLLRVVEARELWVLGADEPRPVELRIIASSRSDLSQAVEAGAFRADLYYRLSGVTLKVPPLRNRKDDILLLFHHCLVAASARLKRPAPPLTAQLSRHLQAHNWPGNVRELEQYAERYALGLEVATPAEPDSFYGDQGLSARVAAFEAALLRETLAGCQGSAAEAMKRLRLPRKTFYDKLNRYGIDIRAFR